MPKIIYSKNSKEDKLDRIVDDQNLSGSGDETIAITADKDVVDISNNDNSDLSDDLTQENKDMESVQSDSQTSTSVEDNDNCENNLSDNDFMIQEADLIVLPYKSLIQAQNVNARLVECSDLLPSVVSSLTAKSTFKNKERTKVVVSKIVASDVTRLRELLKLTLKDFLTPLEKDNLVKILELITLKFVEDIAIVSSLKENTQSESYLALAAKKYINTGSAKQLFGTQERQKESSNNDSESNVNVEEVNSKRSEQGVKDDTDTAIADSKESSDDKLASEEIK